jgi:hypothetical protein
VTSLYELRPSTALTLISTAITLNETFRQQLDRGPDHVAE